MAASASEANSTSEAVTGPTPRDTTSTSISCEDSSATAIKDSRTAANVPSASERRTTGARILSIFSSVSAWSIPCSLLYFVRAVLVIKVFLAAVPVICRAGAGATAAARAACLVSSSVCRIERRSAISLAFFSLATQKRSSPARGKDLRPMMRTGVEGVASLRGFPSTPLRIRIFPPITPVTKASPGLTVPHLTIQSATTPKPFSCRASITTASPVPVPSALRSITSACSNSRSTRSSSPSPVTPLTGTTCTSPPTSSHKTPAVISSLMIRFLASSTSTSSRSTLVRATTMACPPSRAISIISWV
mmetsp:Transcript_33359/g.76993  ORF Transcript_33359/g.76993 Transcript_33359/m.76993 type:complete len:305 (-) Transcript_33359:1145-2059(-)